MAQLLPFHRSAKGTAPELVDCPPTVIHLWVVDRGAGPRVSGCGNSPVLAVLDGLHEAELVAAGGRWRRRTRGGPSCRHARPGRPPGGGGPPPSPCPRPRAPPLPPPS